MTLDRLHRAQKAIYEVASFIYGPLLWEGGYGAVPTPQYDQLENLDKPWIQLGQSMSAHKFWKQHLSVIQAWEGESWWPDEDSHAAGPSIKDVLNPGSEWLRDPKGKARIEAQKALDELAARRITERKPD